MLWVAVLTCDIRDKASAFFLTRRGRDGLWKLTSCEACRVITICGPTPSYPISWLRVLFEKLSHNLCGEIIQCSLLPCAALVQDVCVRVAQSTRWKNSFLYHFIVCVCIPLSTSYCHFYQTTSCLGCNESHLEACR